MGPQLGEHHWGQLRQECAEAKGERIIAGELKGLKCKEEDLNKQSEGNPARLAMAARLRHEATLTIRQMAQPLHLGSWKSLNNKSCLPSKTKESRKQ